MERLTGVIQPYAWGSRTAIPEFLGVDATGEPQAELWLGAHPLAPSTVDGEPLDKLVAQDPVSMVGRASVEAFGPRLPFLLKIIAAAQPLSLQAHPSRRRPAFPGTHHTGPIATAGQSRSCCVHSSKLRPSADSGNRQRPTSCSRDLRLAPLSSLSRLWQIPMCRPQSD